MNFKRNDYAMFQNNIVEILDLRIHSSPAYNSRYYKIRFVDQTLTHWVNQDLLSPIPNQKTVKTLFGT